MSGLALAAWLALGQAAPPSSALADLGPPAAGILHVYFVRHAQAFSNLDPAPRLGPEELDRLTPQGQNEVRKLGEALKTRGVKLIVSSPAGRARETAEALRKDVGAVQVRVDERLRPLELGRADGGVALTWDQRIAEWKAGRDPTPPGGESLETLGNRVRELVREEYKRSGRAIVLVAHSDVVAAYLGILRATPGHARYPFQVRLASISMIEVRPGGKTVILFANHAPEELLARH